MENDVLNNVKDKLQLILNRTFKEPYRRKIDVFHDRINICCPLCYDSRTDIRKKRGNLYLDSMSYHCYNCGSHMGINSLLHHFGEELSPEDRIHVHEIQQSSKKFERRPSSGSSMTFTLLERIAIPKKLFFNSYSLVSPYKNEFASNYLKSRKIDIRNWKHFAFNPNTKELYILNITGSDRVIGYQIRQLDENSVKARYLSRTISKIYTEMFDRPLEKVLEKILSQEELGQKYMDEEDGIENIVSNINRISGLFNIMNIDMSKTITIVEGPIDSLGIDNCIALQGATKMYDFFDKVDDVRFLFDNDKVGKEMSIKKLKEHKTVFLWEMYLKQINAGCKIKDINDLQKLELLDLEKLNKCFSDNELDVVMI